MHISWSKHVKSQWWNLTMPASAAKHSGFSSSGWDLSWRSWTSEIYWEGVFKTADINVHATTVLVHSETCFGRIIRMTSGIYIYNIHVVKTLSRFTPSINKNAPNPQQSRMISRFMHADTRSIAIAHLIPINTFTSKLYIYIYKELYVYIYMIGG